MSDLISREEVLNLIDTAFESGAFDGRYAYENLIDAVQNLIHPLETDLISRQGADVPENARKRTETHACVCISKQAAIDAIGNVPDHNDGMVFEALSHAQRDVALLPPVTPQPEVIRCKDCKHWTNNIGDSKLRDNYCNEEAHGFYYRCSGDDYCSFAERRTDG